MDKYEYKVKLNQMKTFMAENHYKEAAEIADTINWNKIKNVNALIKAGEIYEKIERYEESREIFLMAYDRSPIGRMIIYKLAELAILMGKFEEAREYYDEFVEIAPHDNLKYVLRYKINKAEEADYQTQIAVLEELKEQEYTEEWAYELAWLYHKAGMSEKCIEACDELILWFGDGMYVERALELKMLYQPLSKQQEEKYQQFRHKKREIDIIEEKPQEIAEAGEVVNEQTQIPDVKLSSERFNTVNLQEELKRSMQQIMEATKKEEVADSMDNIKKLVEEIPYLSLPDEDTLKDHTAELPHVENGSGMDASLRMNFQELLAEDGDGQLSMFVPERNVIESQITGQICIDEVLAEWKKTKDAEEAALQAEKQRRLESAKAKALQEAGDIMERLADVIPKLESGLTPKDLLKEQYLGGEPLEDGRAAKMVADMNQILQQEIERLSTENAQMDEQLQAAEARRMEKLKPVSETMDTAAFAQEEPKWNDEAWLEEEPEDLSEAEPDLLDEEHARWEAGTWKAELQADIEAEKARFTMQQASKEEAEQQDDDIEEIQKQQDTDDMEEALIAEMVKHMSAEIPEELESYFKEDELLPEIADAEEDLPISAVSKLSKEQREIFTYFLPIHGMEQQLCQALTGAAGRLMSGRSASTGNMIIEGGRGSGKTVLATNVVKALQKEIGRPKGRVGKIEALALNKKDVEQLFKKVAGGCLIIEKAGNISKETAQKLGILLEQDTSGILVIIEDTRRGIEKALGRDCGFAARFSEKIRIPIFTSDELVEFAKFYARDLGYTIDDMGVLALYNSISNIQKLDQATTLTEVKEIVDDAIARTERGGLKKAFSIIASKRYDKDDYIILREKDFGF